MAATDPAIWLTTLFRLEAPAGSVNLCGGGFVDYDAGSGVERFESEHPVYGTLAQIDPVEQGFTAQAERATISLIPNPDIPITDWLSSDLADSRVRFWLADLDSDLKTALNAEMLGDYLVDTMARVVAPDGRQTLELNLFARDQKLFFINEGNVCSERFHKRIYPGENGFNNCTDEPVPVAWGVSAPPQGTGSGGSSVGSGAGSNVNVSRL